MEISSTCNITDYRIGKTFQCCLVIIFLFSKLNIIYPPLRFPDGPRIMDPAVMSVILFYGLG